MPATQIHTNLLSTGDAARTLGVSRQHVVDLCDRGDLAFVWVGKHRRVASTEIDRLTRRPLSREQTRSLWLHRALLTPLMCDPNSVIDHALENLRRGRAAHREDGMTARYLDQWDEILTTGIESVVEALTGSDAAACELRQNSPFAGVLSDDTRTRVLRSFREHWARANNTAARA